SFPLALFPSNRRRNCSSATFLCIRSNASAGSVAPRPNLITHTHPVSIPSIRHPHLHPPSKHATYLGGWTTNGSDSRASCSASSRSSSSVGSGSQEETRDWVRAWETASLAWRRSRAEKSGFLVG